MTPLVPVFWLALMATMSQSRWRAQVDRLSPWLLAACLTTTLVYFVADRIDARKLAPYFALIERMATVVPHPAGIGFVDHSRAYSTNHFANICTVRFDRRCTEISAPTSKIAAEVEYIAVLGTPLVVNGFAPILQEKDLTVLRRTVSGSTP